MAQLERVAQKTQTCPRCGAEPGERCSRPAFGNPYRKSYLARPHEARVELVEDEDGLAARSQGRPREAAAMTMCARCHHMLDGEDNVGWYYQIAVSDTNDPPRTHMDRVHLCGGEFHVPTPTTPTPADYAFRAAIWLVPWLRRLRARWHRLRGRTPP